MSQNVPASFQTKFNNNVRMRLQQRTDPLRSAMSEQSDTGTEKVKVEDIVGNNEGHEADERHGDTKYSNTAFDGVWIPKPNELYDADLIDSADKLATTLDLQGATTRSLSGFIARARIRRRLEGFYGPIISGKEGTTITPFPGGQVIAVTEGGASGPQKMNTKKLRAANKMLSQGYVTEGEEDLPDRWMVLTADDNDALLTEVPATSSDFKSAFSAEVRNGKIITMLGWRFIHLELDNPLLKTIPDLATDGNGYRKNPFWVKDGVRVNWWQELRTMVDPLPGKLGSTQVFAGTTLGATRTQPEMSGVILNQKG